MTIAAVDPIIADVMLVAEGDRLLERHVNVGGVRRPEDRVARPARAADERNDGENDDLGMNISAARKNLGHVSEA